MASDSGEDLYSDTYPQAQPAAEPSEKKTDEGPETALLPKSFFGACELKPGAECRVRIEQVLEDQVAVSFGSSGGEEGPEPDEEMSGYMS